MCYRCCVAANRQEERHVEDEQRQVKEQDEKSHPIRLPTYKRLDYCRSSQASFYQNIFNNRT